jgi:tRNA/tmRNA/rRNA uracil-C5-methylase (TrmA/RlmC/RlmD family)
MGEEGTPHGGGGPSGAADVMTLYPGQDVEVVVEKPVAGGRMLARHGGQVILVAGAIPGERIVVRVDRVERQLAFGTLTRVVEPSVDRRSVAGDPECGGCLYAHVVYPRQVHLKAALIADAFTRLGRLPLASPVHVASSPERGYRMRARFHVERERIGFYREGSHDLCDARQTGHLREEAVEAVETAVTALWRSGARPSTVWLAENVPGDERVLHIEFPAGQRVDHAWLAEAAAAAGLTGCTSGDRAGRLAVAGGATVSDTLARLTRGRVQMGTLERHASSFFQANRFLLPDLVKTVLDAVPRSGPVIDLYAGVGLFAVSLGGAGCADVTAVEGDASSASDLARNAAAGGGRVRVVGTSVEDFLGRARPSGVGTVVVDPPRTGISRAAMQAVVALRAGRIVYVSCDPPTMARDARRLVDGGYRLASLEAFDLFPNTPHVEVVGIFDCDGDSGRS